MSLVVEWLPEAERELLDHVPRLLTIMAISSAVHRFAMTGEGPVTRAGRSETLFRLRVAGYVALLRVDEAESALFVEGLVRDA